MQPNILKSTIRLPGSGSHKDKTERKSQRSPHSSSDSFIYQHNQSNYPGQSLENPHPFLFTVVIQISVYFTPLVSTRKHLLIPVALLASFQSAFLSHYEFNLRLYLNKWLKCLYKTIKVLYISNMCYSFRKY